MLAIAADTDLFIWSLAWDAHALVTQPLALFDANIYYPQARTLAYSENLLGGAMFSAPVWWVTGNPVLAMNVAALASCVLCGAGAWLLARRLGLGPSAAFLGGVIFAFAPPRFLRLPQLHLTMIQWVPFTLAFLHSYLDTGRRRDLRLAALFFSLQALSSGHGAVFAALAGGALILYRVVLGEPVDMVRRMKDLGIAGAALLLPAMLVMLPYLAVQREMQLRRSLEDASTWSVSAVSFLASPTHVHEFLLSRFISRRINDEAWAYLFPGYLPLLLAVVALIPLRREATPRLLLWFGDEPRRLCARSRDGRRRSRSHVRDRHRSRPLAVGDWTILSVRDVGRAAALLVGAVAARAVLVRRVPLDIAGRIDRWRDRTRNWRDLRRSDARIFYALLGIATLWLSAGPPIGLWPAVYWLPGFNFIRVASRFTLLGMLCLAMLAGFGFERLAAILPVAAAASRRRLRACCSSPNSRTSLWELRRIACSLHRRTSGSMGSRSPSASSSSRFPPRARAERNGGRPLSCSTRWRTGRRPSMATADFVRRCTTSCSGSSACFPTMRPSPASRNSVSITRSFTSTCIPRRSGQRWRSGCGGTRTC